MPVSMPTLNPREEQSSRAREYKTKEQHRLIYSHVGCPLNAAKDLSTSFMAIHDTFFALVLLYHAGWNHRDISAGNIIVVENNGSVRGKLSDLEYAKKFDDASFSADPKTGTPYFMPLEIHRSQPYYIAGFEKHQVARCDINPFGPLPTQRTPPKSRTQGELTSPVKFRVPT